MLFFSSFYPYATKLIADAFFNKAMQGLYGVVVLLFTFSVLGYYKQLDGNSNFWTRCPKVEKLYYGFNDASNISW